MLYRGSSPLFQHTAARRRLVGKPIQPAFVDDVSTHSRPKAAGRFSSSVSASSISFNTQPPEGGWPRGDVVFSENSCFNTQPPEGGWRILKNEFI